MSENTKIEWTDHTFNPWEGCQKVGPGCDHCYAETRNARFGGGVAVNWGPGAPRRRTSPANWRKPLTWNRNAAVFYAQHRRRQRVFCASLGDVFDNAVPPAWRVDLVELIAATPNLDWLILTKRIGNAQTMWPAEPLPNVWLGATIVNQEEAERDIAKLMATPAAVRFLSMEPLLGPVDLANAGALWSDMNGNVIKAAASGKRGVDWVIVGGESGAGARPMHPDWARSLHDQYADSSGPYFFKQWGEYIFRTDLGEDVLREFEGAEAPLLDNPAWMRRVGKKAAGRVLDSRTRDEYPENSR